MSLYFSRKQYFRDTTAPAGLSEIINVRQALPVASKPKIFPEPTLLSSRSDYFGNDLFTYRDIQGNIKTISIMKGANKPRGANANVKWSMTPNKFKRGRGLNSENNFKVPRGRKDTTEFFKSRYQSAFDEMLIEKKIRDADKLSTKKVKVLNKELKKKEDVIDAQLKTQVETQRRVNRLQNDIQTEIDERRRYERITSEERTRASRLAFELSTEKLQRRGRSGFSRDDVGDTGFTAPPPPPSGKGGGKSKGKKGDKGGKGGKGGAPPPAPPVRKKTPEEIEAERLQIIGTGGGGMDDILKAIQQGLTPGEIKKMKEDARNEKKKKKAELIAGGGGAEPPVLTPPPPPAEPPAEPEPEPPVEPEPPPVEGAGVGGEGFTDQPQFLAPATSEPAPLTTQQQQQQAVVDILEEETEKDPVGDTPRGRSETPSKTRFSRFIESVGDIGGGGRAPSKKFLKELEKEAEEQRKKGAKELGEKFTGVVGGKKIEQFINPSEEVVDDKGGLKPVEPIKLPEAVEVKTKQPEPETSVFTEFKQSLQPEPPPPPPPPPVEPPVEPDSGAKEPKPKPTPKTRGPAVSNSFEEEIKEIFREADSKGDVDDGLKILGGLTDKQRFTIVSNYPDLPPFIDPEQARRKKKDDDDLREALLYFSKNQFADKYEKDNKVYTRSGSLSLGGGGISVQTKDQIAFNKKRERDLIQAQSRRDQEEFLKRQQKEREERQARQKESKDRQLKVITDKYGGVDFSRSNKTILTNMFKTLQAQNLAPDTLAASVDRAVRDLNAYLNIQKKSNVRKDMVSKARASVFGTD